MVNRCRRELPTLPPGGRFSHVTAAVLHGLPVPVAREDRLHVTVGRGVYVPAPGRFVVHQRALRAAAEEAAGLPVCSVAEAWFDAAGLIPEDDAVAAGDVAARLVGREALVEVCESRWGSRGSVRAQEALARVLAGRAAEGAASAVASRVRLVAERAGLPTPQLGVDVGGRTGRAALAWPEVRLAVVPVTVGRDGPRRTAELGIDGRWRILRVPACGGLVADPALGSRLRQAYVGTW